MTRSEYYGLEEAAKDFLQMHGIIIPKDSTWDEEVPQSVIDADEKIHEQNRLVNLEAERKAKMQYEKDCKDFSIPTCQICGMQYDPFSSHYCNKYSWEQGGA